MPARRRTRFPGRSRAPSIVVTEFCDGKALRYRADASSALKADDAGTMFVRKTACYAFLRAAFLPAGYPASVRPEYFTFQVFDTVQAASSYLRSILTTSAILKASGVGEGAASPMAAAVAWVLRDGFGMCGSLLFASLVGSGFDENVKEWRLFADLINDVGLSLNMLAPLVGDDYFVLVAALGATCTTICGMVAGATRASITAHFALRGNIADVSAKEGAQETAVTVLGLLVGSYTFAPLIGDSVGLVWFAFGALTLLHVYANWRGVGCLTLPWLNTHRASILTRRWVDSRGTALFPAEVASRERIWGPLQLRLSGPETGARLRDLCRCGSDVRLLEGLYSPERYWMRVGVSGRPRIIFSKDADGGDALRALLQCALLDALVGGAQVSRCGTAPEPMGPAEESALTGSLEEMRRQWPAFEAAVRGAEWEEAALRSVPSTWRFTLSTE